MTPDPEAKKAKLEAILGRLRANRASFGHPGTEVPASSTDGTEPVTLPLHASARPGPAVVPAAAPAPVAAVPQRPAVAFPSRVTAVGAPPPPAAVPRPLARPAVVAPPPPPPVEPVEPAPMQAGHWEGEDEEEMILEEAPEALATEAVPAVAEEEPLAAAPVRDAEIAPPPPPPLASTTVSPTVASAPAEPEEDVQPQRIEAIAPVQAPVIRTSGVIAPPRRRTIGELLGASLHLFEKG